MANQRMMRSRFLLILLSTLSQPTVMFFFIQPHPKPEPRFILFIPKPTLSMGNIEGSVQAFPLEDFHLALAGLAFPFLA